MLFLILCFFNYTVNAISVPSPAADPSPATIIIEKADPSRMKARDIEQLLGRRLTLKERIGWMLVKRQFKKNPALKRDFDIDKKARTAKTLGTIALVGLFIPPLGLLSLPFSIAAIVMGSQVRRVDPENRDAKKAITRGIITLALIVLLILVIVAIASALTIA